MLAKNLLFLLVVVAVVAREDTGEKVYTFGKNEGLLVVEDSVVPQPKNIPAFDTKCILQADVSGERAIFVSCSGQVYLTGSNVAPDGSYSLDSSATAKAPTLVAKLEGHNAVMASVGLHHAIVLTDSGIVFTWGDNNKGQLGFGGQTVRVMSQPTEVLSLSRKNIRLVAAGGNRTAALSDDGKLYMWGEGEQGEMGDGLGKSHFAPTLVKSLNNNGQRVCQVAIGGSHVTAVTNAGDLYAWGNNNQGQLGLGEFGGQKKRPTPVNRLRRNACHLSAGHDFTTAITQDSRLFMWGSDGYPSPFEKTWFQGKSPRQAGSGHAHMVVLLANSSVATWGTRKDGQAGRMFSGEFTLEPDFVETSGISQIAVGNDSAFLLSGDVPAPSLCPCLNEYYMHWRTKVEFKPSCSEGQDVCGDGSCCAEGSTCCRVGDGEVKSIVEPRSIDSRAVESPNFKCVKGKNAKCCDGYGCGDGFKCWGEPKCVPHWANKGMSSEDLIQHSGDPLNFKTPAVSPGFNSQVGVCGARKVTCPDDSCCAVGSTCCAKPDGSFGCCQHSNADCCTSGCCREGYKCDNEKQTCVRRETGVVVAQQKVEGQCGSNKMVCPDQSCCGAGKTCCVLEDGYFGCCPFQNGVCCADGAGCCPFAHTCDTQNNKCVLATRGEFGEGEEDKEISVPMRSTPKNTPTRSANAEVRCSEDTVCAYPGTCCAGEGGQSTCCGFINGTCCEGGLGCCPSGYSCDLAESKCSPLNKDKKRVSVPMKFTRDAKKQRPAKGAKKAVCAGKTQCADDSCCPLGSSCCEGPNGKMSCCSSMTAVCCANGGCCEEGDTCDDESFGCLSKNGEKYGHLSSQETSKPQQSKAVRDVSAPGKCYADERSCGDGLCCPRGATCCSGLFNQKSCCPASHGVCCSNGGCCPGGSSCDANKMECVVEGKKPTKMLVSEPANAAEAEWDVEECWEDEQTCAIDGGCCLRSETCCNIKDESGSTASACCPFKNGVCCDGGAGCCPEGSECDLEFGTCKSPSGNVPLVASKGSAVHPMSAVSEKDCPDGSICNGQDTCCSLGYDEYWGEEIYACCPFENAVCCADFEGCCPNGYACDGETQSCVTEGNSITASSNTPVEQATGFVCLWPQQQCPNNKCCDEGDVCVETDKGGYRCVEKNHVSCGNGSHACPDGTICEMKNNNWLCSVVEETPESVKKELLRKYWGDDTEAACALLLQTDKAPQQNSAPAQFWYPKQLVVKSKAVATTKTNLPTLLVAKICQHLNITKDGKKIEQCYQSNSNGHFVVAEQERVETLINEYVVRVVKQQESLAKKSDVFVPEAEELDPCPCREKPEKLLAPDEDVSAGDAENDAEEEVAPKAAKQEEEAQSTEDVLAFVPKTTEKLIADEKPVGKVSIGMGKQTAGTVPLSEEQVIDEPAEPTKFTLVASHADAMQQGQPMEMANVNLGDEEMIKSHKPETFMGKESCDDAEDAVTDKNTNEDDSFETVSLAQMNHQANSDVLMPEM